MALEAVHENRISLIEPQVIVADAMELGYSIRHELQSVLIELLNHTGADHYVGYRPPEKSYERKIRNLELWAFSVVSPRFDMQVYHKFSLKNDWFFLVSLHACSHGGE